MIEVLHELTITVRVSAALSAEMDAGDAAMEIEQILDNVRAFHEAVRIGGPSRIGPAGEQLWQALAYGLTESGSARLFLPLAGGAEGGEDPAYVPIVGIEGI